MQATRSKPSGRFEGAVTEFTASTISGRISAADRTPLRLALNVDRKPIAKSWTVAPAAGSDLHSFRFNLKDIWKYCESASLTVTVEDESLPFVEGVSPPAVAKPRETSVALFDLLDRGHVFTQFGRLQLSKTLDHEWQAGIRNLYERCRLFLKDRFGVELVACYGTALGAVREGAYIGHDHDFDSAYISRLTDGVSARNELRRLGLALVDAGLKVSAHRTCLWVYDPDDDRIKIDIFHLYFDLRGNLQFPFGSAGERAFTSAVFEGYEHRSLSGSPVLVPAPAELFVEQIYGENWRTPNPGFNWNKDRRDQARDGILSLLEMNAVHWANLYSRSDLLEPTGFAEYLYRYKYCYAHVVELGCGDGRDACGFGAIGKRVLALDNCAAAVRRTNARVRSRGLGETVQAELCDLGDHDAFSGLLADRLKLWPAEKPRAFYARFTLNALTQEVEKRVLTHIADIARPRDSLLLEFRTKKDEKRKKFEPAPFIRYCDPEQMKKELIRLNYSVLLHQTGNGFASHRNEDPEVCRLVAVKNKPAAVS